MRSTLNELIRSMNFDFLFYLVYIETSFLRKVLDICPLFKTFASSLRTSLNLKPNRLCSLPLHQVSPESSDWSAHRPLSPPPSASFIIDHLPPPAQLHYSLIYSFSGRPSFTLPPPPPPRSAVSNPSISSSLSASPPFFYPFFLLSFTIR